MPVQEGELTPLVQTPGDTSVLCYVSSLPEELELGVLLTGTQGRSFGRAQRGSTPGKGGLHLMHHGVRMITKGPDEPTGSVLAQALEEAVTNITNVDVDVNGLTYGVQSVYSPSGTVPLGEISGKRYQLWTLELRVAMKDPAPVLG